MRKVILLAVLYGLVTGCVAWLLYVQSFYLSKTSFDAGAQFGYAVCKKEKTSYETGAIEEMTIATLMDSRHPD